MRTFKVVLRRSSGVRQWMAPLLKYEALWYVKLRWRSKTKQSLACLMCKWVQLRTVVVVPQASECLVLTIQHGGGEKKNIFQIPEGYLHTCYVWREHGRQVCFRRLQQRDVSNFMDDWHYLGLVTKCVNIHFKKWDRSLLLHNRNWNVAVDGPRWGGGRSGGLPWGHETTV